MQFKYNVSTQEGQVKSGFLEAPNREEAAKTLREKNFFILSVTEKRKSFDLKNLEYEFGRIKTIDKVIFVKHLSVMIKAGLPLLDALTVIRDQTSSAKMKGTMDSIVRDINRGQSFAQSLSRFSRVFSPLFVNMIRVGEASGTLDQNLEYLASELEKEYELKKKVKGAMLYPIIVLTATFLLGAALSIFILPKLVKLFTNLKIELPFITRVFLAVADFFAHYGVYVFLGVIGLAIGLRFISKTKKAKPFFHHLYLGAPFFHKLAQNVNLARFSRILGILLKSGLPIAESLEITSQTIDNVIYQKILRYSLDEIKKGSSLAKALAGEEKHFPKIVSRMINVGERTGKLDETLIYLAKFYEEEVDDATKNLATVIEPVLLIFIGVILGGLAIAIITPIYQISGSLRR